jgi:hypothetical protein
MTGETEPVAGWIISAYQYVWLLWAWGALVALFGLWRSMTKSDPDPIRPSGPTGL